MAKELSESPLPLIFDQESLRLASDQERFRSESRDKPPGKK